MKVQMPCGGPDPIDIPQGFVQKSEKYATEKKLALFLLKALSAAGEKVTFAESCTGGLLSAVFCSVPGASMAYDGGLVSYANSVKHRLLSVEESVLSAFGAVSAQCCAQMAQGACALFSAQLGLAVTGFAGPGGGTPEEPVGTVYIGSCHKGTLLVEKYLFSGDRQAIRRQATNAALRLGLKALRSE